MSATGRRLAATERWWRKTNNPLYVWEAIALSLKAEPPLPIPEWCVPYLATASAEITKLSWEFSRSQGENPDLSKAEAWIDLKKQIPCALNFVSPGQKNVFSQMLDDAVAMRNALDQEYGRNPQSEREHAKRLRTVTSDRAQRIIAKGKKMLGLL